jgi:hypothetical protein
MYPKRIIRIAAIAVLLFLPNPERLIVRIVECAGLASVLELFLWRGR